MGILDSLFRRPDTPESLEGEVFSFFRKFEKLLTRVKAVVEEEKTKLGNEYKEHHAHVLKEKERHDKNVADEDTRYVDVVSKIEANLTTLTSAQTLAEKVVSFAEME